MFWPQKPDTGYHLLALSTALSWSEIHAEGLCWVVFSPGSDMGLTLWICSSVQMSHTGEIKNCSQAVTGVSLTDMQNRSPSVCSLLFDHVPPPVLSFSSLPVCSHTRLFWCQTSWLSITAGELTDSTLVLINNSKYLNRVILISLSCRLAGGLPPYASVYPTWVDCWRHLSREVNASLTWHLCDKHLVEMILMCNLHIKPCSGCIWRLTTVSF